MPFGWAQDRSSSGALATTPLSSTSAAPSGRISASPQTQSQLRGHRRGLPQSTSMSSQLSSISNSGRSTSGSQYPSPQPPSSLTVQKASSSAALTNADESDDFRRFLDEAQAKEDLHRQGNGKKNATLQPDAQQGGKRSGGGAAESLRRVTSSSNLSVRSQRGVRAEQSAAAPSLSAKPATTRPPRSVSNYSVTFRNPTSQFLEQLSFEAQTPELGIDDTPIAGRTVDNKSHLTALGHAAQVQSRTASGAHTGSRNGTVKGKSTTAPPPRSSTIAVDVPTASSSRLNNTSAVSTSPTTRSQPLSPRRRPQSYMHKPPVEASDAVSSRKPGATGLGHGLPTPFSVSASASPTQMKRSADEMERSALLQPNAKLQEATSCSLEPTPSQQQPSSPAASRRKTWFGLGWAGEAEGSSKAVVGQASAAEDKDEEMKTSEAVVGPPSPSMNEEEAAFRRSLGYNDVFDPSAKPQVESDKGKDQSPKAFPAIRDSGATIRAEALPAQVPVRERRVSWLPWRNVAVQPAQDEAEAAAAPGGESNRAASEVVFPEEPVRAAEAAVAAPVAEELPQTEAINDAESTITYRTVVKRGWMGARYEVQEPVQSLQDVFIPPATEPQSTHVATDASVPQASLNTAEIAAAPTQTDEATYPPSSTGEDARQGSGTWRWRFWSGQEDQPPHEMGATPVAQQLQVPTDAQAAAITGSDHQSHQNDTAENMDIDHDGPPADAPTAPEGGSWTYSSYLASWVPTWVYNAQQQDLVSGEQAPESQAQQTDATLTAAAEVMAPRTPAEQVKADALARDTSAAMLDANKAVLNSTTKSGWIKFFASRSANLPREMPEAITNDDGMEVMDISDMEGSSRAAVARDIAKSGDRLTPDVSRAPRSRTTTGGSVGGSKASSVAGDAEMQRAATPLSTSRDSVKFLSKAAIAKAANVATASTLGLGKGKRSETAKPAGGASNDAANANGSSARPAKDVSKELAPNGNGPSRSGASTPTKSTAIPVSIAPPNLVLPSFEDTFTRAPRMWPPKVGVLERTLSAVNSYLFSRVPDLERMKRPTRFSTYGEPSLGSSGGKAVDGVKPSQRLAGKAKATGLGSSKDKGVETALKEVAESAQRLPRAWSTVGMHERAQTKGTSGIGKIVVIGIHGWFSQSIFKNMIGEPTGTSAKFAAMQTESIRRHFLEAGLELNPEAITAISLQGDGKVADRVDRLFAELISRPNWVNDLKTCDALFLSAHSQGAIVATQLLARLIEQRHVQAEHTRICLLAMCGIHHGPFAHLKSSITASYINYFETAAAKELFEFQSSSTPVARQYTAALKIILDAGAKCVYVGSTDDNVVPIYSALNSSNNHPSILRALYIDGQAFPKVDFLTNLLVMCVAIRNAGLSDHNLLTLLSASVAGSLYGGRGHSLVYEERAVYDLATRYLFEVTHPLSEPTFAPGPPGATTSSSSFHTAASSRPSTAPDSDPSKSAATLISDPFEAQRWNPYDLPWSLRGLFEDKHVRSLFAEDMLNLLKSYELWRPDPKSKALKDLQWRLAPMRSIAPPPIEEGGAMQDEQGQGQEGEDEGNSEEKEVAERGKKENKESRERDKGKGKGSKL